MSARDSSPVAHDVYAQLMSGIDTLSLPAFRGGSAAPIVVRPGRYVVRVRCFSCDRVEQGWEARGGYADTLHALLRLSRPVCDTPAR